VDRQPELACAYVEQYALSSYPLCDTSALSQLRKQYFCPVDSNGAQT